MNIPVKLLEQHLAILGKTGSGKTVTAKGIVEHLLKTGQRVCVIDPVSAWWGLRSDATGKGQGFPVVIFGGQHGDVPIGASHGKAIAEIVASSNTSTVIDLKMMSVRERTTFFTDFAVTIMQKNQGVLHMVIDEAHLFAPKGRVNSPQAGEMLSETNNLITGGRGLGLRFILITQRPAKLHNDCLTQAETLIAMRLIWPADRDAVKAWIHECASEADALELMSSLPKLKTGEGWVWSPENDILKRVQFSMISTLDSCIPQNLHRSKAVNLSAIDLPAIEQKLKIVAQDVIDSDPKRLRARILELERELKNKPTSAPAVEAKVIEKFVISPLQAKQLERAVEEFKKARGLAVEHETAVIGMILAVQAGLEQIIKGPVAPLRVAQANGHRTPETRSNPVPQQSRAAASNLPSSNGNGSSPSGGLRRMLVALAQRNGLSARQLGVRAGLSSSSGTFGTYLARGRTELWLDGSRDRICITPDGISALGNYDPLPEGRDLLNYWLGELTGGARAMLSALAEKPSGMSAEDLGGAAGLSHTSGTFGTYLSKLRTLELVTGSRDNLRASEELF